MLSLLGIVSCSFILSFVLACGLGANDVSNAFATSIGANVLTLRTAFIIASIAEFLGSFTLGGLVTEKIIKATISPGILTPQETMLVMLASLISVSLWLSIATYLKLPVSATHAVISAMIGAGLIANPTSVCWSQLSQLAFLWLVAPILSGLFSLVVFIILNKTILCHKNPIKIGLRSIPLIYALTMGINAGMIGYQLSHKLSFSMSMFFVLISIVLALVVLTMVVARLILVPWTKKIIARVDVRNEYAASSSQKCLDPQKKLEDVPGKCEIQDNSLTPTDQSTDSKIECLLGDASVGKKDNINYQGTICESSVNVEQIFASLQVLSAIFTSFAHGSNDVSNSIGPLFGLLNAYFLLIGAPTITSDSPLTYALLAFGALGMIVGLFLWGARVIETLGKKLTASISPSRGFSIELGSAITVLSASIAGLSVSTTHCKVGAIVALGLIPSDNLKVDKKDSGSGVNGRLIINILSSWICTIPFAGLLSALSYVIISFF